MNIILWDWDNTLADTIEPLRYAFNETLKHYHLPLITHDQMKFYMNSASSQLFVDLFPNCDFDEVRQIYLHHYQKNAFQLHLLAGASEVLKWSKKKGFVNILASNKHYLVLQQEVKMSGLKDYFEEIFGAEQFSENKPSKVFTDAVLKNFKNYDKLFVVGDGVSDVMMARNYDKAKMILVGTNPRSEEFKDNPPDFWAKDLMEVEKYLNE